ncbi:large ribosomal subunit protein mL41 isoform X1 [Dermacentor andersoni]|uniref:large ribosomal subunit protein mL41 isoform X1 n=1 Tax=Dermacentor andersoni TaxID=34620 RepID=UPI002415C5E7|nr:39S ribosomal protein L41, mitochondrial-like isoform X1 [Dermacentor andersoni]
MGIPSWSRPHKGVFKPNLTSSSHKEMWLFTATAFADSHSVDRYISENNFSATHMTSASFATALIVVASEMHAQMPPVSKFMRGARSRTSYVAPKYRGVVSLSIFQTNEQYRRSTSSNPCSGNAYGVRWPSVSHRGPPIPEMVPELIVPDLTNCQLGPYVSYRAPEVCQGPFTARDLFDAVYSDAVAKDFKDGQADKSVRHLDEQPSPEDARVRARQTGSDIFPPLWRVRKMEDQ